MRAMETQCAPQIDDALRWLRWWRAGGPWNIVSIDSNTKKEVSATTTSLESEAAEWIAAKNADGCNVYFTVNSLIKPRKTKPRREHIAALDWLHVDIDATVGASIEVEQERILRLLSDDLPLGIPKPSGIVFSGGGYQAFWRLKDPLPINGAEESSNKAAEYNRQLELVLGGDHCHNVDRIMRLPGTINWPDAKKKSIGRVPTLARIHSITDNSYLLSEFVGGRDELPQPRSAKKPKAVSVAAATRLTDIDELGPAVSDQCKVVIVQGIDPDNPTKHSSRSEWLWYVLCELVRSEVPEEIIFGIITDPGFAISAHVLDQPNPKYSAERQIARAKEFAVNPLLAEMNDKHAIIEEIGGKCRVLSETVDPIFKRKRMALQTFADFRNRYSNNKIEVSGPDGKPKLVPLSDWWLAHPRRRQYSTAAFCPKGAPDNVYNRWRGFSCSARPGDCSLLLEHILENVCSGEVSHYEYFLSWMASAVQNPATPGQVAVVLRGQPGVGKSFVARAFGNLFGQHFITVSDSAHLVGKFNQHLSDCVVLFGDEAFYAGDKRHCSVLKTLITEETLLIEAKGMDSVLGQNCIHLIMASNEEWVVPAGMHERRFFVLNVAGARMQQSSYFAAIQKQLDCGGYEAFLHFLINRDLSNFQVRNVPQTHALQAQKINSLTPLQEWWYDCLCRGVVSRSAGWPSAIFFEELVFSAQSYCNSGRSKGCSAVGISRFLSKYAPNLIRRQLWGEYTIELDGKTVRLNRPIEYALPTIEDARHEFESLMGGQFDWPVVHQQPNPPMRKGHNDDSDAF